MWGPICRGIQGLDRSIPRKSRGINGLRRLAIGLLRLHGVCKRLKTKELGIVQVTVDFEYYERITRILRQNCENFIAENVSQKRKMAVFQGVANLSRKYVYV